MMGFHLNKCQKARQKVRLIHLVEDFHLKWLIKLSIFQIFRIFFNQVRENVMIHIKIIFYWMKFKFISSFISISLFMKLSEFRSVKNFNWRLKYLSVFSSCILFISKLVSKKKFLELIIIIVGADSIDNWILFNR